MSLDLSNLFESSIQKHAPDAAQTVDNSVFDKPEIETVPVKKEKKIKEEKPEHKEDPERLARTVFISNVPIAIMKSKKLVSDLKAILSRHGKVESMRFRSVPLDKPCKDNTLKKISCIKGELNEKRDTVNVYAVLKDCESVDAVVKELNGSEFEGKHLFFDHAGPKPENRRAKLKRTVFLGGLSFDITEEQIFNHFNSCGNIQNIRLVRDAATSVGKGFGYVLFEDRASATLALQLNGSECGNRKIRVTRCSDSEKLKTIKVAKQKTQEQNKGKDSAKDKSKFKKPRHTKEQKEAKKSGFIRANKK
ncbi:hypothetical protein MP638_007525 [Amoeboaphelidium occidentale]|nr:hypothetical protein MP638_007525 [Amoeboaphelidium occidentale]